MIILQNYYSSEGFEHIQQFLICSLHLTHTYTHTLTHQHTHTPHNKAKHPQKLNFNILLEFGILIIIKQKLIQGKVKQ